eukprot:XP_015575331.1 uncharacterized protein LOC107261331 [Ricinus communis]
MIEIFEPILYFSLIYIDDILLFSDTAEEYHQLLKQFIAIIQKYGIMLLEKKSIIGQQEIEFLGMHFKDDQYTYGSHLTKELDSFPNENLSVKQIQQFLGILNYVREAIPHLSSYTCHLSKMLKKNPTSWGTEQTTTVKRLEELAQNPPPLTILSTGHLILQTDASDHAWGAILLENLNDKEKLFCYHAIEVPVMDLLYFFNIDTNAGIYPWKYLTWPYFKLSEDTYATQNICQYWRIIEMPVHLAPPPIIRELKLTLQLRNDSGRTNVSTPLIYTYNGPDNQWIEHSITERATLPLLPLPLDDPSLTTEQQDAIMQDSQPLDDDSGPW